MCPHDSNTYNISLRQRILLYSYIPKYLHVGNRTLVHVVLKFTSVWEIPPNFDCVGTHNKSLVSKTKQRRYVAGGCSHAANASSASAAGEIFESCAALALLVYQSDGFSSSLSASAAAAVDTSSSASAPSRRPPLVAHFRFLAPPPDADTEIDTATGTVEPGASVGTYI